MSKRDQSILIFAVTVLILFVLNYFVSVPSVLNYNENMAEVAVLDEELAKLELNIQQGAELEAAILQVENNITSVGLDQYYYENYSVHNYYVDTAQNFGIQVTSLSLSQASTVESEISDTATQAIAEHPLVAEQMAYEEISQVQNRYEIVTQTTSLSVVGTINDILDYVDHLAKDDIYVVIPSMTLTDFVNNFEPVTMSLQFTQYFYQEAEADSAGTEIALY